MEPEELTLALDDLWAAYRRIPTSEPHFTIIAIWSLKANNGAGGVRFFPVHGHNFGLESSVVNFSRLPALLVRIARLLLAVPVANYIDDYMQIDLRRAGDSAQRSVTALHKIAGLGFEPDKSKPARPQNPYWQ